MTLICSSQSSTDSTIAIAFPTLLHLTNALVTHFTYAFNIGEVDWPKRFTKKSKINYRLIPESIKRVAMELNKQLYIGPSSFLAYNSISNMYDKQIGLGLYVYRDFNKDEIIAEFIGVCKSMLSYQKYTVANCRGGYAIYINKDYVLDCYHSMKDRKCLASYANCPEDCWDTINNKQANANAVLIINAKQKRARLKAIVDIPRYSEISYKYGDSYVYSN